MPINISLPIAGASSFHVAIDAKEKLLHLIRENLSQQTEPKNGKS